MKVVFLNGSPRKGWNTDQLLKEAECGAQDAGAETEYINLFDLHFSGCRSCFACKIKGGKNNGHCVVNDDLKPVLRKIDEADALILGSPIYFGEMTACARAFYERFMFQVVNYEGQSFNSKKTKIAHIYTMNAPDGMMDSFIKQYEEMCNYFYQYVGTVAATETLQSDKYDRFYVGDEVNEAYKKQRRETVWPETMKQAYNLGKKVCQ